FNGAGQPCGASANAYQVVCAHKESVPREGTFCNRLGSYVLEYALSCLPMNASFVAPASCRRLFRSERLAKSPARRRRYNGGHVVNDELSGLKILSLLSEPGLGQWNHLTDAGCGVACPLRTLASLRLFSRNCSRSIYK